MKKVLQIYFWCAMLGKSKEKEMKHLICSDFNIRPVMSVVVARHTFLVHGKN